MEKNLKKIRNENENEDRLRITVVTSFYVADEGELWYQANVYPAQGDEPAWLAILTGQVGNAPEIPQGSVVPVDYRVQVASAVQQSARWEFDKLVNAVVDSQVKAVIQ